MVRRVRGQFFNGNKMCSTYIIIQPFVILRNKSVFRWIRSSEDSKAPGFPSVEFILSIPDQRIEPGFSVELKTSSQSRKGCFCLWTFPSDRGRVQRLFFLRMSTTNKSAHPRRLYYPSKTHLYSYFALSFNKITKRFYLARPDYIRVSGDFKRI